MNTKILMLAAALSVAGLSAHAQSPGTSAGASAGGSSASGGQAASSTTTGSSLNGNTTGNNGPSEGLSPANRTDMGLPSNAVGTTGMGSGAPGSINSSGVSGTASSTGR
jgi:hypothetical protein